MDLSHTSNGYGLGKMKGAIAAGVLGVILAAALFQTVLLVQPSPAKEPGFTVQKGVPINQTVTAANIVREAMPEGRTYTAEDMQAGLVVSYPLVAGVSLLVAGLAYILSRRGAV
ncbi:MAG: hypothetical protein QW756_03405 [Nitrososphaerota archaeon]